MREIKGDIFELMETGLYDAFCITTNGFIKKNGECVMGAGIAKACKEKYPSLPLYLGGLITAYGNHCMYLGHFMFSFPVKHNWFENADPVLIERSCKELMRIINNKGFTDVLLPRPGCGNGKLRYEDVKPILERCLDDRVIVATF